MENVPQEARRHVKESFLVKVGRVTLSSITNFSHIKTLACQQDSTNFLWSLCVLGSQKQLLQLPYLHKSSLKLP